MGAMMMLYHSHLWYYESKKVESYRGNPRGEREPMPEREKENTQSFDEDDESDEEDD